MDIIYRVSLTRIVKHKITMIKFRQEIIAYTFRNYTRQRIRQLLSHPFNVNMCSYQENMLLCQRVLAVGSLTWVITSHTCGEIFGRTEFAFDFHWWWNYDSADPFPFSPPRFWSWSRWLRVLPNCMYILIWTSKVQTRSIHFWRVR